MVPPSLHVATDDAASLRAAGLRDVLRSHRSADEREAEYRARMLRLLDEAKRPFARNHFHPGHFTASAFVLSPDADRLLLILHGKLGLWLQPGGHVDPADPDLRAAALREVREETGLADLQQGIVGSDLLDVDIHSIPPNPRRDEPAHEHFDVRFCFRATTLEVQAGDDAQDARWVPLGSVEDAGTDDSVRRAVRKLQALL